MVFFYRREIRDINLNVLCYKYFSNMFRAEIDRENISVVDLAFIFNLPSPPRSWFSNAGLPLRYLLGIHHLFPAILYNLSQCNEIGCNERDIFSQLLFRVEDKIKEEYTDEIREELDHRFNICFNSDRYNRPKEYLNYFKKLKKKREKKKAEHLLVRQIIGIETETNKEKIPNGCKPVTVHGVEYVSLNSAMDNIGLKRSEYRRRLKNGFSPQEALELPEKFWREIDGVKYKSKSEAFRAFNVSEGAFRHRVKKGMSIEEALSTPMNTKKKAIPVCFRGKKYRSINQVSNAYLIMPALIFQRMRNSSETVQEALEYYIERNKKIENNEISNPKKRKRVAKEKKVNKFFRFREGSRNISIPIPVEDHVLLEEEKQINI